jgi:hypothetical protein
MSAVGDDHDVAAIAERPLELDLRDLLAYLLLHRDAPVPRGRPSERGLPVALGGGGARSHEGPNLGT